MSEIKTLLTTNDVAERLQISATKVRELAKSGAIKFSDLAGAGSSRSTYRFRSEWVDEYINASIHKRDQKRNVSAARRIKSKSGDRY